MRRLLIAIIKIYKFFVSPILPGGCRFSPTCSDYSVDALTRYGVLKGSYLSVRRLLRCHPFHPGGFDPVK